MNMGLQKQVERTIATHKLLKGGCSVLVALSGGADSVALLLSMHQLGYKVTAVHCNFHLRGEESDRDEQFVRSLCARYQIQLEVTSFHTEVYAAAHKISLEMAARDLRYAWFEERRKALAASAICVAHHRQDQAETLLLNLIRGTGIRGLAGMHYKNGFIVRPMLDVNKHDIEDYLKHLKQEWVDDSTNFQRDALRNSIRLDILPLLQQLNPQAIKNIALAARHMQEALPYYEAGLQQALHTSSITPGGQSIYTDCDNSVNPNSQRSFSWLSSTKGCTFQTKTELHEALMGYGFNATQEDNIWAAHSGAVIESTTHRLLKDRDNFILQAKEANTPEPDLITTVLTRQEINEWKEGVLYLDNQQVKQPLHVRKVQKSDRFTPFGMKGSKLISDLLTERKLNRFEKENQYVLTDADGQIIWVIGLRASNLYRVTDQTCEVLCIQEKKAHIFKENRV